MLCRVVILDKLFATFRLESVVMSDKDDLFADLDEQPSALLSNDFELAAPRWLLGLMDLPKIGSKRAINLAQHFRTLEILRSATAEELYQVSKVKDLDISELEPRDPGSDTGVEVITYFSDEYPNQLRDLADAPPVLWYRGKLPTVPMTAIVGTRAPSPWGSVLAKHIAHKSAEEGIGVVSGLALGIDTQAHEGALEAGGITVAILACDVRNPSPDSNVDLAERIIASGGALISEVPFNTRTEPRTLVARNRIQAALANSLVMVECGVPSGTLHTVRFAFEMGRKVAVCEPPRDQANAVQSEGNRRLASLDISDLTFLSKEQKFERAMAGKRPLADYLLSNPESLVEFTRGHFGASQ
jgi:DNA processing protein